MNIGVPLCHCAQVIWSPVGRAIIYDNHLVVRIASVAKDALKTEPGQRKIVISNNDDAGARGGLAQPRHDPFVPVSPGVRGSEAPSPLDHFWIVLCESLINLGQKII